MTTTPTPEAFIVIARKAARPAGAKTIKARKAIAERQKWSRVKRDGITDLFCSSAFDSLTLASQHQIDSPTERAALIASGAVFVVPVSDLGRVGMATASVAESVRLWIAKNLTEVAPAGSYAVLYVEAVS